MSENIAISVKNVSKAYRIWESPAARLISPLQDGLASLLPEDSSLARHQQRKAASRYRDFYALRDVSFTVKRGESMGIIGRNGCGKSTLLQIIAGTMQPTIGSVQVKGRVAALLELGSGFNPEFTGRENVYLNAAVLGFSRRQIDERFDKIAAFADIGDFLEQPVKTYSSGMAVRLAFAVQTALDPEILIIDEALSVGDESFQRKCFARIGDMRDSGTTLLFVSHSTAVVVELCTHAILLSHGNVQANGQPKSVVNLYHQQLYGREEDLKSTTKSLMPTGGGTVHLEWVLSTHNTLPAECSFRSQGATNFAILSYPESGARVANPRILNLIGEEVDHLSRGHSYWYTFEAEFFREHRGVRFGSLIKTVTGVELGGMASHRDSERIEVVQAGQRFQVRFRFVCRLLPGTYFLNAGVLAKSETGNEFFAHRVVDALLFRVMHESDLSVNAIIDFLEHAEISLLPNDTNA